METRQLVLGTKNEDKRRELKRLLSESKIRVLCLSDFPECGDVLENGRTFEANAKKKAHVYSLATGRLTLADDSGLMVEALNGKPGVYSARFAGEGCSYADNNRKLLSLLSKISGAKRRAKFVCVVALYYNGKPFQIVRGECRGRIASTPKGTNGFGYDPVFIPDGHTKTFAQMPRAVKNRVSHRARALEAANRAIRRFFSKKISSRARGKVR